MFVNTDGIFSGKVTLILCSGYSYALCYNRMIELFYTPGGLLRLELIQQLVSIVIPLGWDSGRGEPSG